MRIMICMPVFWILNIFSSDTMWPNKAKLKIYGGSSIRFVHFVAIGQISWLSFGSFGQAVSQEKIQMWKVYWQQRPSDGKSSHGLSVRWAKNWPRKVAVACLTVLLWSGHLLGKWTGLTNRILEGDHPQTILFQFHFIPFRKPPGQMNQNLVGSICGRSSIKIAHVVQSINKHDCRAILVNDRSISKKSTTKPLRPMNQHLVISTYGRSSIKIAHFVLIS
jgi:hypothetical protein